MICGFGLIAETRRLNEIVQKKFNHFSINFYYSETPELDAKIRFDSVQKIRKVLSNEIEFFSDFAIF